MSERAHPHLWAEEDHLPEAAWLTALAGLPKMGPVRLRALLEAWPPGEAWRRVRAGRLASERAVLGTCRGLDSEDCGRWAAAARGTDVTAVWAAHTGRGITVVTPGDPGWPVALTEDPEPPPVLFVRGDVGLLGGTTVAVIGTRRCTPTGHAVARELGEGLARAGVRVASGLALGIDGSAHGGALAARAAPPVGVVGTGLDIAYPRAHAALTDQVADVGAVVSEYPLGTPPAAWRFPARNRILAALSQVVVVVESPVRGGSMHTVDAALERDRTVLAVPGSVRNPAAAGTNALLAAGCAPARDVTDVLVAVGLGGADRVPRAAPPPSPAPSHDQRLVLDALGWDAATLEQVADRLDVPLGPVALHLADLERLGAVARTGAWYTRLAPPPL